MKHFSVLFFLMLSAPCFSQHNKNLKLWYNSPAGKTWESALPIGNGRLGAMVFGNVEHETIQLNEHTVWSGGPHRNDNAAALQALPELRQLIWDGKQKEAEQLANKVIISKGSHGQKFQPVGNLLLNFPGHERYENYYRELDIERAVTKTSYTIGAVTYSREVLASFPDRVIVVHLTSNKPKSISFTAELSTPHPKGKIQITPQNELTIHSATSDHEGVEGKILFSARVRIKTEGGIISLVDSVVTVKNADAATLYISIATNFNSYNDVSGNQTERAKSYLDKAFTKSFPEILKGHVFAYQKYFNRVKIDLGTSESENLPTDVRLRISVPSMILRLLLCIFNSGGTC